MVSKKHKISRADLNQGMSLKTYDDAVDLLARIRTLAGLLEAVGIYKSAETLDVRLASMTGSMIIREVDQLHHLLKSSLKNNLK